MLFRFQSCGTHKELRGQIVAHFPSCRFELVRGNHDILSEQQYRRKGILVKEKDEIDSLLLTHELLDRAAIPKGRTNIAGHIHPGARLLGKGRQSLIFPCFWQMKNQMILPAFGSFTGFAQVRPSESDRIFIIVEDKLAEIVPGQKNNQQRMTQ